MDVPKIWVVVFDMHTVIDGLYTIYSIQFHLIRLISRLLMTIFDQLEFVGRFKSR